MIYNATIYNDSWNTKKLKELGDFSRGKSKHRPRNDPELFNNGTYPLVQTGDIKAATLHIAKHEQSYNEFGLSQSKLWPTGTLCITIAANIAETGILAYPMCFPDSIVGFTANQTETSELFMHYVFTYIRQSIQNSISGSIQDNINIEYLKSLDFKIPEKSYQDKIVAVLSGIDEKIELNLKICSELEDMAKTIYDYWFVQFDFPDENGKPYRSSSGEMVWNEQLKREIPKGWEVSTVGKTIDKIPNTARIPSSEYLRDGLIPVIDQSSDFIAGYTNNPDSVLKSKSGYIVFGDHTRIVKYIRFPFARGADGTQVLKSNNPCIPEELFYQMIKSIDLSNYGYARHFKFLKDTLIVIPEKNISGNFAEITKPIYEKQAKLVFENIELSKFRDWLLPMLMNGQVRIE